MKRIILFGSRRNDSGENSRWLSLYRAFAETGIPMVHCVPDFGFAPPDASPLTKIIHGVAIAPFRWIYLITHYAFMPAHDVLYVPYPSYLDGWLACILGKLFRKKVILDAFIGLYDTIVRDRRLFKAGGFVATLIWHYEKWMLRMATRVLVDTESHARMLREDYQLPGPRVVAIPVGIDEHLWTSAPTTSTDTLHVLFWGTFIPFHGVDVIAKAARLLADEYPDIHFRIIGKGQSAGRFREILNALNPGNIEWIDQFIPLRRIRAYVEASDCCLGVFGENAKTHRVIPYKVYQTLASARPLITAKANEMERLLEDGVSALLIPPGDPKALADAIVRLRNDRLLARRIGINGRGAYDRHLSFQVIKSRIGRLIQEPPDRKN